MNFKSYAEENFKTVRTNHFAYHYADYLQDEASQIANTTEQVAIKLSQKYGVNLDSPVDVRISNALYSNGQAISLLNRMRLWVSDWDIRLRTTHPWQADVATHEFTHLATLGLAAKLSTNFFGIQAMYQSYYNDASQARIQWLMPLSFHTAWLAEGIAQYESEQFGFDSWDSHRDMVLRVAHHNKQLLNFSKMDNFNSDKEIELETGPYTQGFALVRFIAHRFGDSSLVAIWKAHSDWANWSLDQCLEDVIQMDGDSLFVLWNQYLDSNYQDQKETLAQLVTGDKLSYDSFNNHQLRAQGDSLWWLGNLASSSWREKILVSHDTLFYGDSTSWADNDTLVYPQKWKKTWLSRGWDLNNQGQFLRTSYVHRDTNDHTRLDLFLEDSSATQARALTFGEDAFYPKFGPNKDMYYIRRPTKGNDFELIHQTQMDDSLINSVQGIKISTLSKEQKDLLTKYNSHKRVLFSKAIYEKYHEDKAFSQFNIYSLDVNKTGEVVISFYDGFNRQLAILTGDKHEQILWLAIKQTDLRDPHWGPDGKLFFSWNLNGIFNLYEFNTTTSKMRPLTNVLGGAFDPTYLNDKLFYSGYDKDGFSLYRLSLQDSLISSLPTELPSVKTWQVKESPIQDQEREFAGLVQDYNSLSWSWFMSPMFLLENRVSDGQNVSSSRDLSAKVGAAVQWQDPLDWHQLQIRFLTEVDQGVPWLNQNVQSDLFARYDSKNNQLPWYVDISTRSIQVNSQYFTEDGVLLETESGISLSEGNFGLGQSPFNQGDTIHAYIGAEGGRQEIPNVPSWWFQTAQYVGLELGYHKGVKNGPQMTSGIQARIVSELRQTDLQDSVYQKEQYTMSVDYKTWMTNKTTADLLYVIEIPTFGEKSKPWALGLKANLTHVEKIHTTAHTDSLDPWLQPALWLDGYPFLADVDPNTKDIQQEVLLKGDNKVLFEAHLQHPLWESEFSWRGYHHKGAWLSWIFQAGQVWDGSLFKGDVWTTWDYQRSFGIEFRSSQKVFHNMPLEFYLKMSRALDQPPGVGDLSKRINYLEVLPQSIRPTTLYYGITFSFQNPLVYSQPHNHVQH